MGRPPTLNPARDAALAAGEAFYWPDQPCINGHRGPRRVSTGHCFPCIQTRQLAFYRDHKEALDEAQRQRRRAARPNGSLNRGRRSAIVIQLDGEELLLPDACQRLQIKLKQLYRRVAAYKINHQAAINWYVDRRNGVPLAEIVRVKKPPRAPKEAREPQAPREPRVRLPRPPATPQAPRPPHIKPARAGYYLEKADLLEAVIESQAKGRATDRLGAMLMLLAQRYFRRHNLHRYSFVDEMREEALMLMLAAVFKFNPARSSNAFAYFTTTMKNVAARAIKKFKQEQGVIAEETVLADIDLETEATGSTTRR